MVTKETGGSGLPGSRLGKQNAEAPLRNPCLPPDNSRYPYLYRTPTGDFVLYQEPLARGPSFQLVANLVPGARIPGTRVIFNPDAPARTVRIRLNGQRGTFRVNAVGRGRKS